MKLVTDVSCRLQSSELFKPNTPYNAEVEPDGSVRLVELTGRPIPIVKPRRINGRLRGAGIKVAREVVAAAIRAERHSR
jgi:hypothetical protein